MEFIYGGLGAVAFGSIGKIASHFMQRNVDMLRNAKNVKDKENRAISGFAFIEGNLTSTQPFVFKGDGITLDVIAMQKEIKAAQQESFKFAKAQSSGASERLISPTHANYFGSWKIDDIGIVPSLRHNFPLTHLHSQFDLRHGGTNVNVVTSDNGEQYGTTNVDTIGIRSDVYGIVDQTEYTVVGNYDANSKKFTIPQSSVTIVTQQSMQELVQTGQNYVNFTNGISTLFVIAGAAAGMYGGVNMNQSQSKNR
jgi:hypothetical protein